MTIFDLSPILYPQFFTRLTRAYIKLFPLILKNTDQIITISDHSKNDIARIFLIPKDRITITYLGVDEKFKVIEDKKSLDRIIKKYNLPKKFILFVGTIEPRKNLPVLVKAFNKIKNSRNLKLVIAGEKGWKYEDLFKTIDKLKLENKIIFTGFVDEDDLPLLYNLAEVFVYPSSYEGFGLPVLEAMGSGCPVITSKVSSLPEICGGAAILVNLNNKEELVDSIKNVIINKQFRSNLRKKSLEQAKRFSWKNCARETLRIYHTYESL